MRKLLLPNKCWLALAVVALLAVGCGLEITKMEFSTDEPAAGSLMTVTTTLGPTEGTGNGEYWLLYAIRVPNDWNGMGLNVMNDSGANGANVTIAMEPNKAYADFCQYCFPRDGYKWVAYSSTAKRAFGKDVVATVALMVGNTFGEYELDVMTGGWDYEPAELIDEQGNIDVEKAFGWNYNRSDVCKTWVNVDGSSIECYNVSEYLMISGTISDDERNARIKAMAQSTSVTHQEKEKIKVEENGEETEKEILVDKTRPFVPNFGNVYDWGGQRKVIKVTSPKQEGVYEVVALSDFGDATGNDSYKDYSYTSANGFVYNARFMDGFVFDKEAKDNNAGIVVSANCNGYIAKSVTMIYGDNSIIPTVDIFGNYKAYESPSDVNAQDDTYKLASVNYELDSKTVPLDNGEYNFIGFRAGGDNLSLNKIAIMWVPAVTPDAPVIEGFTDGEEMQEGDQISIKCKPGQHLHYIIEKQAQFAMKRAAATEGWTPAESHEYTYTLNAADLPVKVRAKAVNGAGTHESSEVAFGIDSSNVPTGIEAIEAEGIEAKVEWFNMQGVRVENPAQGLYIRRQGNKAEKIFVK